MERGASPIRSPLEQQKRRALLDKIAKFEARGAILQTDARTLRSQLHDSASGEWKAVEVRLQQLSRSWNPYQDDSRSSSAAKRPKKEQKKKLDFYQLLELENGPQVATEDVKRQFRKLALLLHPDKKRASRKSDRESDELDEDKLRNVDSTQFARLRLAYETLSDPERRAAYDAKLQEDSQPQQSHQLGEVVKDQVKLEASSDFASLEWMARVKHKMDVMARIAEWAKLLSLNATELRFETGDPCTGEGCGKIVTMDRDLECSGSPRRRVYICLLHKYIHACDESCTSTFGDAELDRRVCRMRAYWLIQNWLFDQLQAATLQRQPLNPTANELTEGQPPNKKQKQDVGVLPTVPLEEAGAPMMCGFEPSEIHLGDQYTRFQVEKIADCQSAECRGNFQFLEDGIYACRRHGTPHICTFEQCDRQKLHMGSYICWVSGKVYGREREQAGTDVRTRRVVYSDALGDEHSVEMEVPVMLPLGETTGYLLEGDPSLQHSADVSSLSPPPPDEKAWKKRQRVDSGSYDEGADDVRSPRREVRKKFKRGCERDRETSPVRKRLRECLVSKIQWSETKSFPIFLKLPPAVAILPKVALELEEAADSSSDDEDSPSKIAKGKESLLQIFVNSHHTVNYIKYWMEELTEQQLSIWDQQIYWGDTLIGEETDVMVLEEHGVSAGCVLELRLHDDCPLLVSTWNGKNAAAGGGGSAPIEYNTVQISKEAAEDLDDLQDEWENVVAAEEQAFEESRLKRQREKLELRGAIEHTEVLHYDDAKSKPRLLGVIQTRTIGNDNGGMQKRQLIPPNTTPNATGAKQTALVSIKSEVLVKEEQEQVPKGVDAMRSLSNDAQPVHRLKKMRTKSTKK